MERSNVYRTLADFIYAVVITDEFVIDGYGEFDIRSTEFVEEYHQMKINIYIKDQGRKNKIMQLNMR